MSLAALGGLFARTFVVGLAVAAPVGAMGVLCIQRTLERGARAGLATGLGVATADGIYASIAAFGVAALSATLVEWQMPLRVIGGLALIGLGVKAALSRTPAAKSAPEAPRSARFASLYGSAVGLTLTNPMTIIAFGAIFASAGLAAQSSSASALIATLGVASGSLTWWVVLVAGVASVRAAAKPSFLAGVNVVSGLVVAGFGVLAITSTLFR